MATPMRFEPQSSSSLALETFKLNTTKQPGPPAGPPGVTRGSNKLEVSSPQSVRRPVRESELLAPLQVRPAAALNLSQERKSQVKRPKRVITGFSSLKATNVDKSEFFSLQPRAVR